jgi:hypothetical protein
MQASDSCDNQQDEKYSEHISRLIEVENSDQHGRNGSYACPYGVSGTDWQIFNRNRQQKYTNGHHYQCVNARPKFCEAAALFYSYCPGGLKKTRDK